LSVTARELFGRKRGGLVSFNRKIDFFFCAKASHFLMRDFVSNFCMCHFYVPSYVIRIVSSLPYRYCSSFLS
jgi:hypothetical protein